MLQKKSSSIPDNSPDMSERLLRLQAEIVMRCSDMVVLLDMDSRILIINKALQEQLADSWDNFIGKHVSVLKDVFDVTIVNDLISETVRTGNQHSNTESFEYSAWTVSDSGNTPDAICIMFRDISEIRKTSRALRESEEKYRSIFDYAPLPTQSLDEDGNFISVNRAWIEALGYKSEEVVGTWFGEFLHIDSQPVFRRQFKEFKRLGQIHNAKFRMRRKDDRFIDVSFDGRIGYWPDGTFKQTYCTFKDTTREVAAENALKLSEKRYRTLHDITPIGIITVRLPDLQILSSNPAIQKIIGSTDNELCSTTIRELLPEDDVFDGLTAITEVQKQLMRKDGSFVWVSFSFIIVPSDEDTEPIGIVAIADKTSQRAAEKMILESEALFRNLFNTMTNGVAIYEAVDEGDNFIFKNFNPAGARFGKVNREDVIGLRVTDVFPGVRDMGLLDCFRRVWRTGETEVLPETKYVDNNRDMWVINTVFKLPTGEVVAVYNDITIQKQHEAERSNLEMQLRQAQKMDTINQLAGGIAHDFNNVLQAVLGYCNLLEAGIKGNSPLADYVREITAGANRAADLASQLLAFSRQQILQRHEIDVHEIITRTIKLVKPTIDENIRLRWHANPNPLIVNVDENYVEQVLMNLFLNALAAMDGHGTLTISVNSETFEEEFLRNNPWAESGTFAVICVADTGTGMDELTLQRVFEPFFSTKEVGKGTGLGLSTAYGIVKQHEGFIHVESKPEVGSSFSIYLPLAEAPENLESPLEQDLTDVSSLKIFLVEDDPTVLRLTKFLLEEKDYIVVTAADGETAMDILEHDHSLFDILILDIMIPGRSGREVLKRYHELKPSGPAILMSGYSIDNLEVITEGTENVLFLQKPYAPDTMFQAISTILGESKKKE